MTINPHQKLILSLCFMLCRGGSSGLREDKDLVSITTSYPVPVQHNGPLVVQAGTRDTGNKCFISLIFFKCLFFSISKFFLFLPFVMHCCG